MGNSIAFFSEDEGVVVGTLSLCNEQYIRLVIHVVACKYVAILSQISSKASLYLSILRVSVYC